MNKKIIMSLTVDQYTIAKSSSVLESRRTPLKKSFQEVQREIEIYKENDNLIKKLKSIHNRHIKEVVFSIIIGVCRKEI